MTAKKVRTASQSVCKVILIAVLIWFVICKVSYKYIENDLFLKPGLSGIMFSGA